MKDSKLQYNLINIKSETTQFTLVDSTLFELFSSTLYDGVWYSEKSHPQQFVINESFNILLGYKSDEKFCWEAIIHPDDIDIFEESLSEIDVEKEKGIHKNLRFIHKSGSTIWVRYYIYCKPNPQNVQQFIFVAFKDISYQRNNELQLQRNKALLQGISHAAEIGIWEVNLETYKVYWSSEIKNIFGVPMSFEPTLEEAINFYKKGESREKVREVVTNALQKGENYDIEVEIVNSNKKAIWGRSIGVSEYNEGKCIRLFGFFQNIHEKTIATKKLAIKEELFRKTFSNAPLGMAILDVNENISQINKRLCISLGYSKKELLYTNINKFSHPQDQHITTNLTQELLENKRQSFKIDKRYIHKNGSTIWTQISVSSVKNDKRQVTHFIVQVEDITERKKNELLLINYQDLLDRSNYVAKIGSWEFNMNDQSVNWSKSMLKILEIKDDLVPGLNEFIALFNRYTPQKKALKSAFDMALNEGKNFDIQILITTNRIKQKWIRLIGRSEFVNGQCSRLYGLVQDITDIKKAQLAIAVKEEQWRTTFNHAKTGMALINFNGKADNVNKSLCDIFGYSMKEMLDIGIKDISINEDIDKNIALMESLISGNVGHFTDDIRFRHKDGHIIWANVSVSAVKNDDNRFTHMVAQVIDITESKTNQILLKKYKNSLEHSNSVAKIGSWEIDPETKILFWSDNLRYLLGNTTYKPRVFSDTIKNYVLEESQNHLTVLINDAIETGHNFDVEIQLTTAMGRRWMRILGISDFENGSCKLLHGLIQDIDDFKTVEQEILLMEEEFKQSFWQAPIGMALMDLNGKVTKVNPAICETFGYTENEMINQDRNAISHPDDIEMSDDLLTQVLNGERDSFQQEKRYFHKNGNLIWATLSISGVKNDKGEITLLVAQIDDITDIKLLTESLQEHNNRLQNYAHIVSHNLRSHTGNLSMMLELIELNGQGCNSDLFAHIKSASNNMNETVHHLSEIVEINSLIKETLVPQNLKKSVNKSVKTIQAALKEVNGRLTMKFQEDYMVDAVPSYLDSIVVNLLSNAIKFRSPSRPLKIEIKAEKDEGHTLLSISDNGLGIDIEKNSAKIFGMYKTFHEHKNARGIGLFISKNQIEAMGGYIEVESKPNIGSTFTIYFKDEKS